MQDQIEGLIEDYEHGRLSRRDLVRHLASFAALAAAGGGAGTAASQERGPTFRARGVDHVALEVADVERSREFYQRHLGLEPLSCSSSQCFLSCGSDFLALFRSDQPGLDHYSFAIEGYEPGRAVDKLQAVGLTPVRHGNRVYFRDPDGFQVQVSPL